MTDISISDIERISHKELDLKIGRLEFYLQRVTNRLNALDKRLSINSEQIEKINNYMLSHTETSKIEVKR